MSRALSGKSAISTRINNVEEVDNCPVKLCIGAESADRRPSVMNITFVTIFNL